MNLYEFWNDSSRHKFERDIRNSKYQPFHNIRFCPLLNVSTPLLTILCVAVHTHTHKCICITFFYHLLNSVGNLQASRLVPLSPLHQSLAYKKQTRDTTATSCSFTRQPWGPSQLSRSWLRWVSIAHLLSWKNDNFIEILLRHLIQFIRQHNSVQLGLRGHTPTVIYIIKWSLWCLLNFMFSWSSGVPARPGHRIRSLWPS